MKEKIKELSDKLSELLNDLGFVAKKSGGLTRSIGDCMQEIRIVNTKVRGEEKLHISVAIAFTYKKLNQLIMDLQDDYRYKGWATEALNINLFMCQDERLEIYIIQKTDLDFVAREIESAIRKYAVPFWNCCDTIEKLENEIYDENRMIVNHLVFKPEWNMLGISFFTNNHSWIEVFNQQSDKLCKNQKEYMELKERICRKEKIR